MTHRAAALGIFTICLAAAGASALAAPPTCSSPSQGQTALQAAVQGLGPGEWCELPTNNLGSLAPGSVPVTNWGDSMARDTANKKIYMATKSQGIGEERRFVVYHESTNTWAFEAIPAAWDSSGGHGYDSNVSMVNSKGEFFTYDWGRDAWKFDTNCWPNCGAGAWTNIGDATRSNNDVANAMEWFPDADGGKGLALFFGGIGFTQGWDGQSWRVISGARDLPCSPGSSGEGCGWGTLHMLAQYNPVHKVVLIGGGNGEKKTLYKLDANLKFTRMRNLPSAVSMIVSTSGTEKANLTVDPVTGDYLYWGENDRNFWRYDVVSDSWAKLTADMVNPPVGLRGDSSSYSMTQTPLPDYGATFWVWLNGPGEEEAVYIYKHGAAQGDRFPPTVPRDVRILGTTSGEITLGWTASTDDTGVAGYRVYRNGAFLAETSETTYADTAISAGQVYGYEITAYDDAGNESARSAAVHAPRPNAPRVRKKPEG